MPYSWWQKLCSSWCVPPPLLAIELGVSLGGFSHETANTNLFGAHQKSPKIRNAFSTVLLLTSRGKWPNFKCLTLWHFCKIAWQIIPVGLPRTKLLHGFMIPNILVSYQNSRNIPTLLTNRLPWKIHLTLLDGIYQGIHDESWGCSGGNLLVYQWGKVPHCESKTASKTSKNTSMKLSHKTQAARWSLAMAAMPEPATLLFFKMSLSGQKTRGSLTWTMKCCLFHDGILIN